MQTAVEASSAHNFLATTHNLPFPSVYEVVLSMMRDPHLRMRAEHGGVPLREWCREGYDDVRCLFPESYIATWTKDMVCHGEEDDPVEVQLSETVQAYVHEQLEARRANNESRLVYGYRYLSLKHQRRTVVEHAGRPLFCAC